MIGKDDEEKCIAKDENLELYITGWTRQFTRHCRTRDCRTRDCYGYFENPLVVEVRPKNEDPYYAVINRNTGKTYFEFDESFEFEIKKKVFI